MPKRKKRPARSGQVTALRSRVAELEETLRAIRMGEVDAVLVSGPQGDQVFTLQGAEHPYRLMVETIDEGAATLADDGTVLYANRSFAEIFNVPLEKFIGAPLNDSIFGEDRELLDSLIADANKNIVRGARHYRPEGRGAIHDAGPAGQNSRFAQAVGNGRVARVPRGGGQNR